jgi:hypothetical protein
MNYEQSLQILTEDSVFNIELVLQELHNELTHAWQPGILVHNEQITYPLNNTNP